MSHRRFFLSALLAFGAGAAWAQAPDPAALQAEIAASKLDPGRAVTLKNVKLGVGLGTLRLEDGVLIPATPVGGKTIEMVFLGKGRLEVDPPDAVEAGQLDLFTGGSRLDLEFKDAVLVVGLDAAVTALLKKPPAQADAGTLRQGEELYASWQGRKERKILNAERGILLDALGDPAASGYFAALFRGSELGDFLYAVEPDGQEQVTLGRFVPLDATEKEKRKIAKELAREQRKGRLLGVDLDDLGQWDTWLSASLRNGQGKPSPGAPTFEPRKYTLEVTLGERAEKLTCRARIDLDPVVAGSRAVLIRLPADFQVQKVTDAQGADLYYRRNDAEITVILPRAPAAGEPVSVNVEYGGGAVEKDWNLYTLRDTIGWYPHAGVIDRAAYDVTFRWPRGLELVSSGRRADGGESPDGRRWERRVLEIPSLGFSFEVGRFKTETAKAGHVDVTFAFGSGTAFAGRDIREVVKKAVVDSLQFYEETYGPYPLDHLVVTTANRSFSQGMLGFVTLSNSVLDGAVGGFYFIHPDSRLVVAHEIAHQWWGNQVGWTGYRDQWISEAMASYSARLFGKQKLDNVIGMDLIEGWQANLTSTLKDGRSLESVGPVVLGSRLFSSRADGAYQAIVYDKGAIVLDMLARLLGEDDFPKVLRQILKVENGRTISTEELFSLIERITSADLKPFTEQFVYGTGLPQVLYSYQFEKKGEGWVVKGQARQQTPHRYRYKVVPTPRGTFDVEREALGQIDVQQSALVVPVDIETLDPKQSKGKGKDGANSTVRGNILVKGAATDFAIDVEHEPKAFFLDRNAKVFGRFFDESHSPKLSLIFRADKAAMEGKADEALVLYDKALATEDPAPEKTTLSYANIQWLRRLMSSGIELSRARILLDQGKDGEAEAALGRAERMLGDGEDFKVLRSRLDVRRGDYEKAFKRLRKGLAGGRELDSSEQYALLAIAARQTRHKEELDKAVKKARENGADVSLLTASGG